MNSLFVPFKTKKKKIIIIRSIYFMLYDSSWHKDFNTVERAVLWRLLSIVKNVTLLAGINIHSFYFPHRVSSAPRVLSEGRTMVPQTALTSGVSSRINHSSPSLQSRAPARPTAAQKLHRSKPQTSQAEHSMKCKLVLSLVVLLEKHPPF